MGRRPLTPVQLGRRIQQARKKAGLKRRDLAKLCGVTHGAVNHWESGGASPTPHTLQLITASLGITMSDLFGDGPQPPAHTPEQVTGGEA